MSHNPEKGEAESTVELLPNREVKVVHQKTTSPHKSSKQYLKVAPGEEADLAMIVTNLRKIVNVLTAMVVGAVLGIIVLIIVVAVLFSQLSSDLRTHKHAPSVRAKVNAMLTQQELCFKCSDLLTGPSDEEKSELDAFRKEMGIDGHEMCCVDTASQLLKQIHLFIENKFWKEVAQGNVKLSGYTKDSMTRDRPAALLVRPTPKLDRFRARGSIFAISEWTRNQDVAFIKDFNYRHGRLIVHSAGYYYIYSQISFLEQFDDHNSVDQGRQSQSLSHYIFRVNLRYMRGGEERLLQNSQTKCWSRQKSFGEYSSYIGAVIKLRQGDEIYVKVSNLTILSQEPKANYFGMYKL